MKLAYMMTTPEADAMPLCWHGDAAHVLRRVAEIGYQGIELQVRDPEAFDTKAFAKSVRDVGLEISAVSTGSVGSSDNLYLTAPDPDIRRRAIERYTRVLQLAHDYGVNPSIGKFRGTTKWAPTRAVGLAWFRDAMEQLVPIAESLGVRIVLEPQTRYNSDILNSIAETVAFIDEFGGRGLAFEADLHHQALEESSMIVALIEGFKSGHMSYVQICDSNRTAPGWGNFNFTDILGTLRAIGYDGWLAMEFYQRPDSDRAAQQAHRFVTSVLQNERP